MSELLIAVVVFWWGYAVGWNGATERYKALRSLETVPLVSKEHLEVRRGMLRQRRDVRWLVIQNRRAVEAMITEPFFVKDVPE